MLFRSSKIFSDSIVNLRGVNLNSDSSRKVSVLPSEETDIFFDAVNSENESDSDENENEEYFDSFDSEEELYTKTEFNSLQVQSELSKSYRAELEKEKKCSLAFILTPGDRELKMSRKSGQIVVPEIPHGILKHSP